MVPGAVAPGVGDDGSLASLIDSLRVDNPRVEAVKAKAARDRIEAEVRRGQLLDREAVAAALSGLTATQAEWCRETQRLVERLPETEALPREVRHAVLKLVEERLRTARRQWVQRCRDVEREVFGAGGVGGGDSAGSA